MSAISAIDIALWDIKGKALNAPVYELLGGKCRDRVRSYAPVFEFSAHKMAEGCKQLKAKGFTAARLMITDSVKAAKCDIKESIYSNRVHEAVEKVRLCREAVGDNFDLCLEVHRSMNPAEAVAFSKGVEKYHPMFIEDPIPPDNIEVLSDVARSSAVPVASGERFINIQEFELLLAKKEHHYPKEGKRSSGFPLGHMGEVSMGFQQTRKMNTNPTFDLQTIEAKNVAEAIELLTVDSFDLIVMDLNLPIVSGYDFLYKMKELKKNIPVLILTSQNYTNNVDLNCISKEMPLGSIVKKIENELNHN